MKKKLQWEEYSVKSSAPVQEHFRCNEKEKN